MPLEIKPRGKPEKPPAKGTLTEKGVEEGGGVKKPVRMWKKKKMRRADQTNWNGGTVGISGGKVTQGNRRGPASPVEGKGEDHQEGASGKVHVRLVKAEES